MKKLQDLMSIGFAKCEESILELLIRFIIIFG